MGRWSEPRSLHTSARSDRTKSWEGFYGVLKQEFCVLNEADVDAVILELHTRTPIQENAVRSITRTTNQRPCKPTAVAGITINVDNLNTY